MSNDYGIANYRINLLKRKVAELEALLRVCITPQAYLAEIGRIQDIVIEQGKTICNLQQTVCKTQAEADRLLAEILKVGHAQGIISAATSRERDLETFIADQDKKMADDLTEFNTTVEKLALANCEINRLRPFVDKMYAEAHRAQVAEELVSGLRAEIDELKNRLDELAICAGNAGSNAGATAEINAGQAQTIANLEASCAALSLVVRDCSTSNTHLVLRDEIATLKSNASVLNSETESQYQAYESALRGKNQTLDSQAEEIANLKVQTEDIAKQAQVIADLKELVALYDADKPVPIRKLLQGKKAKKAKA